MKRALHLGICSIALFLALQVGQLNAQQPEIIYVYDDLGRLAKVVENTTGQCAIYDYDAVGNILSITRSTNCLQSPNIAALSQSSAKAGSTACLTITGSNFLGAVVTTDNPEILVSSTRASESSIEVCLTISLLSSIGPTKIFVTTASGVVEGTFQIELPDATLITQSTVITAGDRSFDGTLLTIDGALVTIDGSHRFRSLTLQNGAVLTHSAATATTTSRLDLTVDGTLVIDATSRIDVSGKGYVGALALGLVCSPFQGPPQTDGCKGRTLGNLPGSEINGGYGGLGVSLATVSVSNPIYGDYRQPVDLGSGGGAFGCGLGCQPGGNGGGAVKITAGDVVLDGSILANGAQAPYAGSGGSIWLTIGTLSGIGVVEARGARGTGHVNSSSGGGRIAIYYTDASGFDLSRARALGGTAISSPPDTPPIGGGAGTVLLKMNTDPSGHLVIDNGSQGTTPRSTPLRAVGSGTSTNLTANMLTDSAASFSVPDIATGALGLRGLELNPNTGQDKTFTIIDNAATTLVTDPADGDMTAVASASDEYSGVEQLDEIVVRGKASFDLGDPFLPSTAVTADDAEVLGTSLVGGTIQFSNGALADVERIEAASLDLVSGSTVTHPVATTTEHFSLTVEVDTLSIDATSAIDTTAKGFLGALQGGNDDRPAPGSFCQSGRTIGNQSQGGSACGSGGSYGGLGGGARSSMEFINSAYGDYRDPNEPGSGAGSWNFLDGFSCPCPAGNGGGLIRVSATDILVDGSIRTEGGSTTYFGGGGSGGAINITTSVLRGAGSISAIGGSQSGSADGGGGGGGRVAVQYDDASGFDITHITAAGARGGPVGNTPGGAGTIYLKSNTQQHGDLIVDNGGLTEPDASTPLRAIGPGTSSALATNVLTNDAATFRTPDPATGEIGLIGLELNPNIAQGQSVTITDNTATTLTADPADGDMTAVAAPGNTYVGVYTFDNLVIRNGASMVTADNCTVLGTLDTSFGTVVCNNLSQYTVPGNVLSNPDFESGPGVGWTEFSNTNRELINTTRPRTGSFSAELCVETNCTEYIEQTVTVPNDGTLTYYRYLVSGAGELKVELYSLEGTLLTTLRMWDDRNSNFNLWLFDSVSLASYAGQTVRLRFTATTVTFFGVPTFYIDDVGITSTALATTSASAQQESKP